jgi:hypothetical protein
MLMTDARSRTKFVVWAILTASLSIQCSIAAESPAKKHTRGDAQKIDAAVRRDQAQHEYGTLIRAYLQGADTDALSAGARLARLYPEELSAYRQFDAIMTDLRRSKKRGTSGMRAAFTLPADFEGWSVQKKTAFLIDSLDEFGDSPVSRFAPDKRVAALVAIGESAVPALIDAIETDDRLTRFVSFRRDPKETADYARGWVLTVRDEEVEIVTSILRVELYDIVPLGEAWSEGGLDGKRVAARLRTYWKKYGRLPFDERMMAMLVDPESSFEAKRDVAVILAHLKELGPPHKWAGAPVRSAWDREPRKELSPAVSKFKNPTAAQAILAGMDRDLKDYDSQPTDSASMSFIRNPRTRAYMRDWERRRIEDRYFEALIDLGDRTITNELVLRFASAKTVRDRRLLANAAHQLGQAGPMSQMAHEVDEGKLRLPADDIPDTLANDQPGTLELRGIVQALIRTGTAEADRALFALARPPHPFYEIASSRLRELTPSAFDKEESAWFSHPYCLTILRHELDNPDRATVIAGVERKFLDDATLLETRTQQRCYQAEERLIELIFGWTAYYPFRKAPDEVMRSFRLLFDRFPNGYRRLTRSELESLNIDADAILYIPQFVPLTHPATPADVTAGAAVFSLDGKSVLAALKLPAVGVPKNSSEPANDKSGRPRRFIIVQAEVDGNGNTIYGVIGDGFPRTAKPEEFISVKSLSRRR